MIDHFNLPVSDLKQSRAFYSAILESLGYHFILQDGAAIGFGRDSWRFGLIETPRPFPELHVAFEAPSRDHVSRFFDVAVRAGGKPNGRPGLRAEYAPNYFAAFVLDPDGHNVEAVCRKPE